MLSTCLPIVREAMDHAVPLGVPEAAARDFLLGHLKVELGIVFQLLPGATFSDGALQAIEEASRTLFQPGWKAVFDHDAWMKSIRTITAPRFCVLNVGRDEKDVSAGWMLRCLL